MQADATGALEAVKAAIGALPQDRVQPRFLLAAASDITRSDVDLAFASDGIILGFNIEPSEAVLAAAKQYGEPWDSIQCADQVLRSHICLGIPCAVFPVVQLPTKGELYGLAMSPVQRPQSSLPRTPLRCPAPGMPAVWRDETHFAGAGDSEHLL